MNQIELQGRSFAGESVKDYHIVEANDIVYTKSPLKANPYGIIKVNKGCPGIVSTLYAVYHVKNNACPKYVDYYFANDLKLNKFLKPLVNIGAKHDMKVNNETVLNGIVVFPSFDEQEKIVTFLSLIDERIEKQRQLVDALKRYKRGLFLAIYSTRTVDWKRAKIREYSKVLGGYAFDSKSYNSKGMYSIITIGNVSGNRYIDITNSSKILEIPADIQSHQILHDGDIVISMTGNVGRVSIVKQTNCLLNQRVAKLNIEKPFIKEYIYQVLSSSNFEQEMSNAGQGAAQKNIKNTDIENFTFYLPQEEQMIQRIAITLQAIDGDIMYQESICSEINRMKRGFLQQLFI